ncbi:uncharacterized protein LOC104894361 [Beta vulgaris subsp. vulgaris]|uniref:uncharacterized protein LOC104894361 n=1 Tax=Beta vulgaris subsp. vulgaris TaxID=3555 RepID=UPI000901B49E|nr:uncharacterized protein LOC104894361 [Beta vulgaris subsp. vulgaris]
MDEKIARWILDFLLRTSIDEKIINGVLSCLPLPNNDSRLKKTILLRKIESETINGVVSEKILELLEIIEELDHRLGKLASDLMKEAYCAVAVDCTVRFLEENVVENGKYFEAVERVWRNRVCRMEGLISEESNRWLRDIEAAVWDSGVCEKIWRRNTRNEALKAVKGYVKDPWKCIGPTYLEFVANLVRDEGEELRRGNSDAGGETVGSDNPCCELVAREGYANTLQELHSRDAGSLISEVLLFVALMVNLLLTEPVSESIAAAFASWLSDKKKVDGSRPMSVSIGHDSRISASMLQVLNYHLD